VFSHPRLLRVSRVLGREILIVGTCAGIILAALHVIHQFAVRKPLGSGVPVTSGQLVVQVGSKVTIRTVDFSDHMMSLVLVSSPDCKYCLQSEAFHKQLANTAIRSTIPFYAIIPRRADAVEYIAKAGLSRVALMEWSDLGFQVSGTPTLIAVDKHAIARRMWVGRLDSTLERSVIELAAHPDLFANESKDEANVTRNYSFQQLDSGRFSLFQLIDVRERSPDLFLRRNEIRIPLMELSYRAPVELDNRRLTIVNCASIEKRLCDQSVSTLRDLGFRVATAESGSYAATCAAPIR
jgi:hypothetical protein